MKKTKCKTIKKFIKEEQESSKDYKSRGFIKQGKQEHQHSRFFKKMLKSKRCRRN